MKKCAFFVSIFLAIASLHAEKIVVKTFPDQYKDNGVGSIFSDAPSALVFYTWAADKKFIGKEIRLEMDLPAGMEITRFSVTRVPRKKDDILLLEKKNGVGSWSIEAGAVPFTFVYQLSKHPWRPTVPWSESVLIVFVKPTGKLPASFQVPWKISGDNIDTVSGVMKLKTMPAPKIAHKPKHKAAWTTLGCYREAWDMENLKAQLKIFRDMGMTGIIETGGNWFPEKLIPVGKLPEYGLRDRVAMQVFGYAQRRDIAAIRKAGFPVSEKDCVLDAGGKRHTKLNSFHLNIYCVTAMGLENSPMRAWMRKFYGDYIKRGFNSFFTDYEPTPYDHCYCDVCRAEYARFSGFDKAECMKLKPGELAAKDPWMMYKFRCYTYAKVLNLLRKELRTEIGWNSNLNGDNTVMKELKSRGCVYFAEDPRLFDDYVSYHDADVLGTELSSVYALELFMQKKFDGTFALRKPVIARATSLHWVNWGFICIYGRQDFARKKGFQGLGVDFRRMMHRLEIAQDFAIGISGVEVTADAFSADAEALTGIAEGLDYIGEFEDYVAREKRIERKKIRLYDSFAHTDILTKNMKKGYLSNWFLAYHRKWGSSQIVGHCGKDYALFSLFNWNYWEPMNAVVESDVFPKGKFYANVTCNGERYTLPGTYDAETIRQKGFALNVPAGSIGAVLFSPKALYPVKRAAAAAKGKLVKPYEIPASEGEKPFFRVSNAMFKALNQKYPNAGFHEVPVK